MKKKVKPSGPEDQSDCWERLWVGAMQSDWASLALVPAVEDLATGFAARALADVGKRYKAADVPLIDAQGLDLSKCRELIGSLAKLRGKRQTVLALDSPLASQAARLIARSVDAIVLVVPMGSTRVSAARATLEAVGAERVIGSLTLAAPQS